MRPLGEKPAIVMEGFKRLLGCLLHSKCQQHIARHAEAYAGISRTYKHHATSHGRPGSTHRSTLRGYFVHGLAGLRGGILTEYAPRGRGERAEHAIPSPRKDHAR